MTKRWPLHPVPYPYETLYHYMCRLAECYNVGYKYFCRRALAMSPTELERIESDMPPINVLKHLSNGTGVSVERLELMTFAKVWECLMKDLEEAMSSDGYKIEFLLSTNL